MKLHTSATVPVPVQGSSANMPALLGVSLAHFVNDVYSSFLYPLLPVLVERLHLTKSQAFWLIPFYAVVSNILQPVYGMISDRWLKRGFAVFGPLLAAVAMSALGLANSYMTVVWILLVGGVGVGIFHPQAAAMAVLSSGEKRRLGMSFFSAMGTLGIAFGPFLITRTVERFGMASTMHLCWAGVVAVAFLYLYLPAVPRPSERELKAAAETGTLARALQIASGPLLLLYSITVVRAATQILVSGYYPFILKESGASLASVGNMLTIFLLAGGLGGFAGGMLAERFSGRAVTLGSGLIAGPLIAAALVVPGTPGLALLAAGGFALISTIPVNVAMAQELVPHRTATVSALMMGFAWGIGAFAPRLFEPLTAYVGYRGVIMGAAVVTFASSILAYSLPRGEKSSPTIEDRTGEPISVAGD